MSPYVNKIVLDGNVIHEGMHIIRGAWWGGGGCGCGAKKNVGWNHWPDSDLDIGCIPAGSHQIRFEYVWHGSTCECANIHMTSAGTLMPKGQ